MILIWGRKVTRKQLGRVADFCPICREPKPHRIWRIGTVPHFYWIPVWRSRLEDHEVECEDCGTQRLEDIGCFVAVSKDPTADLQSLISQTRPSFLSEIAGRLEFEQRVRSGRLEPDERLGALVEPFQLLESEIAPRTMQTQIDRQTVVGCLVTVLLLAVVLIAAFNSDRETGNALSIVAAVVLIAGIAWFVFSTVTDPARFVRRELHPRLVRALAPLRPSREELTQVAQGLRSMNLVLGKKLNMDRLWDDLQTGRDAPPIEPI